MQSMSFRFRRSESVADAVRRIAADQLDRAIASLEQAPHDTDAVIHDIRRRCKRLRALIRLVRSSLTDFKEHDNRLRDTAASLSQARDAAVLSATHATVVARLEPTIDDELSAAALRRIHGANPTVMRAVHERRSTLDAVNERLATEREMVDAWKIEDAGFDAIRAGLRVTYQRSRRAMRKTKRSLSSVDCHAWRKRVKYHAYQMGLLRAIWPGAMRARESLADELGDQLGDAHDLAVYRAAVGAALCNDNAHETLQTLGDTAERLRNQILRQSWPLGDRLFVLKPNQFIEEMEAYWDTWRDA